MMGIPPHDSDCPEFVEVDPTGRFGRYDEVLGKGASKTVYKAFDEYEGMEVAWNQVKLYDFLQSPDDLERLYCEIHLLKTLKHKNIMKFYASWVDVSKRNINFVTEMFTSGTLRQYRQMHKRVHIRAVKHWCRQILMGLLYLHGHNPPIIHRDLKCDNIFINGNHGEVKIGDLGLAAILRKSHAVHCVGTPEFMAPEVYEEEYNELVDIYSFGMCVLEMVTFEYPYSECTHPAQIYKKVITGAKPDALYRIKDPEVRQFIEKCLAAASERLSARELLVDPFLQTDNIGSGYLEPDIISMGPISRQPSCGSHHSNGYLIANGSSDDLQHESDVDNDWEDNSAYCEKHGIDLFDGDEDEDEDESVADVDIAIKGRKGDDGGIFIRLKIGDKEGRVRNIYFPFDTDTDTALGVAAEMIDELDITDHEVTRIAEMIDGEVSSLVPEWKARMGIEEISSFPDTPCFKKQNQFEEISCRVEGAPQGSEESHSDQDCDNEPVIINMDNESQNYIRKSHDYENKIPKDPQLMKSMYRMRVKDFRRQRSGRRRNMNLSLDLDKEATNGRKFETYRLPKPIKSFHLGRRFSFRRPDVDTEKSAGGQPDEGAQRVRDEELNPDFALEKMFIGNGCYNGDPVPTSLSRARSLCI
ncbi:uncharacterized protein A4U43_C08F9090 [Asparagus officinalis]|uniref:probable serine/threonine-protein kinase WNK1 isoform X2 n=1 Tax=Asparagus officinalis TaxID=4686 RepID=UPI00098E059C|nr:probable serine/threonine-protein kinase WNK1 isoform X2 [Asparagus officinalis]ONK59669.1 uncharacterized protein A4U43_C08F9090 [Asparagus officinalis]